MEVLPVFALELSRAVSGTQIHGAYLWLCCVDHLWFVIFVHSCCSLLSTFGRLTSAIVVEFCISMFELFVYHFL